MYLGGDMDRGRAASPEAAVRAAMLYFAGNAAGQPISPDPVSDAAASRARALLERSLTPEQLEQFKANGWFDVVGGVTGMRYRIRYGSSHNVELLRDGTTVRTLCFFPRGNLPPADVMLAQKISIESDENGVLAVANFSSVARRA